MRRRIKKLKKDTQKKGTTIISKDGASSKVAAAKKKASGGSDEARSASPAGSQHGDDNAANDNDDDDDDDVQWQTDTSLEAAKQRIQVTAEMVMLSANEPDQEKKPQKAKKQGPANGTVTEKAADKAGAAQNGVGANTYETLIEEIKGNLSKESTPGQLHTFLGSVTESPQEVMTALFEALFNGAGKGFAKEVCKKMNCISAAVQDEGSQMLLLRVIEAFCGKCGADAVKEVALVLKVLSDGDVLEDESIVQWYKEGLAGGKNSQALKNARPFVEWLQNAESESEEE